MFSENLMNIFFSANTNKKQKVKKNSLCSVCNKKQLRQIIPQQRIILTKFMWTIFFPFKIFFYIFFISQESTATTATNGAATFEVLLGATNGEGARSLHLGSSGWMTIRSARHLGGGGGGGGLLVRDAAMLNLAALFSIEQQFPIMDKEQNTK